MIGNLLGLKKTAEKNKILTNAKALIILGIFFQDWYSQKEASKIYNPAMPDTKRNERIITYYFPKFKKFGWLEERKIKRIKIRKTKYNKQSNYPSYCIRYRLNFEPYFSKYYDNTFLPESKIKNIKKKLLPYLNNSRDKIIKKFNKNFKLNSDYVSMLGYINEEVNKKYNKIY